MRSFVTAITFVVLLVAPAVAQAGPVRNVLGLALRGGKAAAKAPLVVVKARPARRAVGRLLGR